MRLTTPSRYQFIVDALNVFNRVTFVPTTGVGGTQLSSYQAALPGSSRTIQLGSRLSW
jgi:hypothetical protein